MARKCKTYVLLPCVALIGIILAIWTLWGNTALVVSEFSISSMYRATMKQDALNMTL